MPSTRGGARHDLAEFDLPSDDDSDPDYCEESSEEESDGTSMRARDRAQWVVDNVDAVEELYEAFKEAGQQLFGRAFFQIGDITRFSHFIYNNTTP